MNPTNLRRYLAHIKKVGDYRIDEKALEQDLMLSTFLSEIRNDSPIDELVFKGGTLLTKNHLGYHRISEDLDFTHAQSTRIRTLPRAAREREIKRLIVDLLDEIETISERCGLEFTADRTDERYVRVRNSRAVYVLMLHYISALDNRQGSIRLEINFVEDLIYEPEEHDVLNIIDHVDADTEYLASIGYDLKRARLRCYPVEEIIIEKLRALLTREEAKERDIFDLFLINQTHAIPDDPSPVHRKVDAALLTNPRTLANLRSACRRLERDGLVPARDVKDLALIRFDQDAYERFEAQLTSKLRDICASYERQREGTL